MKLFGCDSTSVRLIDDETFELVMHSHRGYTADALAKLSPRRKIEEIDTDPPYGDSLHTTRWGTVPSSPSPWENDREK